MSHSHLRLLQLFVLCQSLFFLTIAPPAARADALARAEELRYTGKYEEALILYAEELTYRPDSKAAKRGVETVLMARFPAWSEEWALRAVGIDVRPCGEGFIAARLPRFIPPPVSRAPREQNQPYEGACHILERVGDRVVLRVTLHSQTRSEAAWAAAEPLARLSHEARALSGVKHTETLHIWWREAESGGGETVGADLYLRTTATDHTDGVSHEFVRLAAHELGHALLPKILGLGEPEDRAEGYIAEALLPQLASNALPKAVAEKFRSAGEALRSEYTNQKATSGSKKARLLAGGMLLVLDQGGREACAHLLLEQDLKVDSLLRLIEEELSE